MIGSEKSYPLNLSGWAIAKYLVYFGPSHGFVKWRKGSREIFGSDFHAVETHFFVHAHQHQLFA